MKSVKSYNCKIAGNTEKVEFLDENLKVIEDLSWFVFTLGTRFGKHWWFDQKKLYNHCRKYFPDLNSKILQNFISLYQPKAGRKLPKHKPIRPGIFVDQAFNIQINPKNKLTNFWLRFSRRNFPLLGKYLKTRILDPSKVKLIQIFRNSKGLYCKLSYVIERVEPKVQNPLKIIGLDVNTKRIVLSNNIFYSIKKLFHRKIEHFKNNQRGRNLENYTKDFLHKLTSQISKDLFAKGTEVLVLEDLKGLRKSASRKLGTSKGKKLNYIINSMSYGMFRDFLEYKCLDLGIKVETIHPAYTSKTCSRCNEKKNTLRPRQAEFVCRDCNFKLDADLNGSRNIEKFYRVFNGLPVNLTLART